MKILLCALILYLESVRSQFQYNFQFNRPQQQQQPSYNQFNIFNPFNFQQTNNQNPFFHQQVPNNRPQTNIQPQIPNRVDNIQYPNNRPQNNYRPVPTEGTENLRLSERKCKEYIQKAQNSVLVGSLSLLPSIQGVKTDKCDSSQGLIIGGENAKAGEFPHMAAIGYRNLDNVVNYKCGGSLISERHVLTAAHCRIADRERPSEVRLGDLNLRLKENSLPEQDVAIESFIAHESYDPNDNKNDIAIIKLVRDVSFSKYIRPACLATPNILLQNRKAIATGWGLTEVLSSHTSDIMQKVELSIIDNDRCNSIFDDSDRVLDNTQVCAGELNGGKDTCQGDSGGPLQLVSDTNKCVYILIGITSYGSLYCGSANSPGVYAKVSSYIDWIERKVWGA